MTVTDADPIEAVLLDQVGDPPDLSGLGIGPTEVRIYLALLSRRSSSRADLDAAPELADIRITGQKLQRLVDLGLLLTHGSRPTRYACASPEIAIERAARRTEQQLLAARASIPDLVRSFGVGSGGRDQVVELVTGSHELLIRQGAQLFESAREEVRTFQGPALTNTRLPAEVDDSGQDESVGERADKVGVRAVYSADAVADPAALRACLQSIRIPGTAIRVANSLPCRLFLYDQHTASVTLVDDGRPWGLCVVRESELRDALDALFEATWRRAAPLTAADDSAQETRVLLSGLSAGLTDHAISRQLGWSRSTFQRRLRALMEEHGVRTRFQLGQTVGHVGPAADGGPDPLSATR